MATYDVADRSAIVTGAGSGIGRAVATLLAQNGAAVLVADISQDAADAVVREITTAGGPPGPSSATSPRTAWPRRWSPPPRSSRRCASP